MDQAETLSRKLLILLILSSSILPVHTTCLTAASDLCLTELQVNITVEEKPKRDDIRQHYFEDIQHYSNLSAIVNLTQAQIDAVLEHYGDFFSASPTVPQMQYIYNGTLYNETETDSNTTTPLNVTTTPPNIGAFRRKRQVEGDYLCPSTGVYQDIQFSISQSGSVLQMVQLGDLKQWVYEETCNDISGGAVETVCVERLRTINAIVINVDDPNQPVEMEAIQVTCCSTRNEAP